MHGTTKDNRASEARSLYYLWYNRMFLKLNGDDVTRLAYMATRPTVVNRQRSSYYRPIWRDMSAERLSVTTYVTDAFKQPNVILLPFVNLIKTCTMEAVDFYCRLEGRHAACRQV